MAQIKNSLFYAGLLSFLLSPDSIAANYLDTNTARMQAMDKITGRVSEIDVPINSEVKFGSFSIIARRCVTASPEETPENIAFIDVADTYNTQTPINIFKGWMLSSSPALNAVEHPIYDVWLLKCLNTNINNAPTLSPEALNLRDNLPSTQNSQPYAHPQTLQPTTEQTAETNIEETNITPDKEVVSIVVTASDTNIEGTPKALVQVTPNTSQEQTPTEDEENGFEE